MRGGAAIAAAVLALGVAACGGDDDADSPEPAGKPRADAEPRKREPDVQPSHCPPEADNCRSASGRIVYVERVDPDGDGDAHFVLLDTPGVTGPGITVVDVERSLRPHPLPGPGDQLSAAGPVFTGSYGQRQIQATELHVAAR